MSSLKSLTVTIHFPADMDVSEDRARWYVDHAIRGYWRSFALDSDPIREMSRCRLSTMSAAKEDARHG